MTVLISTLVVTALSLATTTTYIPDYNFAETGNLIKVSTLESLDEYTKGDELIPRYIDEFGRGILLGAVKHIDGKKLTEVLIITLDTPKQERSVYWLSDDLLGYVLKGSQAHLSSTETAKDASEMTPVYIDGQWCTFRCTTPSQVTN